MPLRAHYGRVTPGFHSAIRAGAGFRTAVGRRVCKDRLWTGQESAGFARADLWVRVWLEPVGQGWFRVIPAGSECVECRWHSVVFLALQGSFRAVAVSGWFAGCAACRSASIPAGEARNGPRNRGNGENRGTVEIVELEAIWGRTNPYDTIVRKK